MRLASQVAGEIMGPIFGKRASGEQNPMDVTRHGDYNAMEIINGVHNAFYASKSSVINMPLPYSRLARYAGTHI